MSEFIPIMDMIDVMPPGLYEVVMTEADASAANPELISGKYIARLEQRHARRYSRARRQRRRRRTPFRDFGSRLGNQSGPLSQFSAANRSIPDDAGLGGILARGCIPTA